MLNLGVVTRRVPELRIDMERPWSSIRESEASACRPVLDQGGGMRTHLRGRPRLGRRSGSPPHLGPPRALHSGDEPMTTSPRLHAGGTGGSRFTPKFLEKPALAIR